MNANDENESDYVVDPDTCLNCFCFYNEIWAKTVTLVFQDAPFFGIRIFILLNFHIVTHLNIFFTCKNMFLLGLHLNRIRSIYVHEQQHWLNYKQKVLNSRASGSRGSRSHKFTV